ncbi:hypothetical protein Droror1_Dr00028208, partial [Drosera rotundifolia]
MLIKGWFEVEVLLASCDLGGLVLWKELVELWSRRRMDDELREDFGDGGTDEAEHEDVVTGGEAGGREWRICGSCLMLIKGWFEVEVLLASCDLGGLVLWKDLVELWSRRRMDDES